MHQEHSYILLDSQIKAVKLIRFWFHILKQSEVRQRIWFQVQFSFNMPISIKAVRTFISALSRFEPGVHWEIKDISQKIAILFLSRKAQRYEILYFKCQNEINNE